ncbi:MAG: hypothetical protein AB7E72_14200 [Lysobacterales bacterium]
MPLYLATAKDARRKFRRGNPLAAIAVLSLSVGLAPPALAQKPQSAADQTWSANRGDYPWNYPGTLTRSTRGAVISGACSAVTAVPRVLIAGDSWAQFMWDDDAHNQIFDRFGQSDKRAVSRSLGSNPGAGYSGLEYAVSGSEAREWVNTASYPWIANVVSELNALTSIDTVVFSLGGNDVLAGKSGGGWYKDMDLDVPGSEAALFQRILADSSSIVSAFAAVRSNLDVLVSSYEYPNFNVSPLWCWIYACPKRNDLSRDPANALVTDAELNALNLAVESRRIVWTNSNPRLYFDHGVGEMHHYYGDGQTAPGLLPRPGQQAPDYLPIPGGNPSRPSLRENFRVSSGIPADPIHLDQEGYLYKVAVQTESYFFPRFRGAVSLSLSSQGGVFDGWTDGVALGNDSIQVGDDGARLRYGIVSVDTSAIPPGAEIASASLYLLQDTRSGSNPFVSGSLGAPRVDIAASFGAPELELSDASAPATASDVGCAIGSANNPYDALRIDLTPAGLAAINRGGITQFRIAFSQVDPGVNRVQFKDGDAVLAAAELRQTVEYVDELQPDGTIRPRAVLGGALVHRGLAEATGSAKPFLDVRYTAPLFQDGFE